MPRYSLTSQNSESVTWVRPIAPAPMAMAMTSGDRDGSLVTIGRTIPAALIMATVAEPTAKCRRRAMSQARMTGLTGSAERRRAMPSPMPEAMSTSLKAPPAPMMRRIPAIGPKDPSVRSSRSLIPAPRLRPSDQ